MSDFEVLGQLAGAAPSEEEVDQARKARDYSEDPSGTLEARRLAHPVPNLSDDQVRDLASDEARGKIIEFEVTSERVYRRKYELPEWPGEVSGITIGIGYDVGWNTPEAVRRDLAGLISADDIETLTRGCGLRGDAARRRLGEFRQIRVPWEAAIEVFRRATVPRYGRDVLRAFPNAVELKGHCFGALLSLVYNRGSGLEGDRRREMLAIRDLMGKRQWAAVPAELRNMKRLWPNTVGLVKRRETEAGLFESGLKLMARSLEVAGRQDRALESRTTPDFAAIEGDGYSYEEIDESDRALERVDSAWKKVVWPSYQQAPDYSHIPDRSLVDKSFLFGPRELEFLIEVNGFQPSREHGRIIFALRGAQLVQALDKSAIMDRQENREALILREGKPDHNTFRCVIGVYDIERGRMHGYQSSTVPNPKAVASYVSNERTPSNMMLTGCYQFEVGWHQPSKPDRKIPGCLIENARHKAVLRTRNDHVYELTDVVHDTTPGDNVHPGKSEGPFPFSSWGCLVLKGSVNPVRNGDRANVEHTGEWARFRKAIGLADRGTGAHGRRYDVVLLTGLDAAIAADALRRGLDPAGDTVRQQLYRLRQGSQGWRVAILRRGLGMPAGERFDAAVASKLAEKQRAATRKVDAIYSPASDAAFGLGVFSTPGPLALLERHGTTEEGPATSELDRDRLAFELGARYEASRGGGRPGEDGQLEGLGGTIIEFGSKALVATGNALIREAELMLRSYVCGGGDGVGRLIDRDGIRQRVDAAAKTGLGHLKHLLVVLLRQASFSFAPQGMLERLVDFVLDEIVLPHTGGVGDAVVRRLDGGAAWLCTEWSRRIDGAYGATSRSAPSSAQPDSSPPDVAPPPGSRPVAAQSEASKLLAALEDAASADNTDAAEARKLIHQLDSIRTSGALFTPEENQRFLDVLCNTRFMAQLYAAGGADLDPLVEEIEAKLRMGPEAAPEEGAAATRFIGKLYELLADARIVIQPSSVKRLLKALRSAKRFEELSRMADRLVTRDPKLLGLVSNWYAQGLIDSGRLVAAIEVLNAAAEHGVQTEEEAADADGILGRAHKQIYVNYVRTPSDAVALRDTLSDQLKRSVESYGKRYDPARALYTYYQGINYIAVLKRAERDRVRVDGAPSADQLARGMIEQLEPAAPGTGDPWLLASLGEAYLAIGNTEKAAEHFGRYANHPAVDAFQLSGTVRQLEQVWQLSAAASGAGAILTGLKSALAGKDNGFVSLSHTERRQLTHSSSAQFQHFFETKVEGGKFQKLYDLQRIIRRGAAVAGIQKRTGSVANTVGTGFLIKGADLRAGLSPDRSYVLTNAHVLWDREQGERGEGAEDDALRPDDAQVIFETMLYDSHSEPFRCTRVIWQSKSSLHDATLFELDRPVPAEIKPLELASRDTPLDIADGKRRGTRLAVVGHPEGGSLSVSVLGSLDEAKATLVDKGPNGSSNNPIFLHYRTPTEPGNSGSPVFEVEDWKVVALHHAGYDTTKGRPKLGGKAGRNFANEGIWIESIREALRAEVKEANRSKRRRWFA